MSPSSESGVYKAVNEIDKRVAVIENEQKHFVDILHEFSVTVRSLEVTMHGLQATLEGVKFKFWSVLATASFSSSVVTAIIVSAAIKFLNL